MNKLFNQTKGNYMNTKFTKFALVSVLSLGLMSFTNPAMAKTTVGLQALATQNSLTSNRQDTDGVALTVSRDVNAFEVGGAFTNTENANVLEGTVAYPVTALTRYRFTPVVGLGVGYGQFDRANDSDGLVLSYNVGVRYAFTDALNANLSYKQFYAPNVFETQRNEFNNSFLTVGVSTRF
jgi:predicted porin